jgi:hypothetical protein
MLQQCFRYSGAPMDLLPKNKDASLFLNQDIATEIQRKTYEEPRLEALGSLEEYTRQVHIQFSAV